MSEQQFSSCGCCCKGAADSRPRAPAVTGDLDPTQAPMLQVGALVTRSFQTLR